MKKTLLASIIGTMIVLGSTSVLAEGVEKTPAKVTPIHHNHATSIQKSVNPVKKVTHHHPQKLSQEDRYRRMFAKGRVAQVPTPATVEAQKVNTLPPVEVKKNPNEFTISAFGGVGTTKVQDGSNAAQYGVRGTYDYVTNSNVVLGVNTNYTRFQKVNAVPSETGRNADREHANGFDVSGKLGYRTNVGAMTPYVSAGAFTADSGAESFGHKWSPVVAVGLDGNVADHVKLFAEYRHTFKGGDNFGLSDKKDAGAVVGGIGYQF